MCPIIVGIIAIILSIIIALLALSIGGYPRVLKLLFYLHFRPARFYLNAMRAIGRLEALNDEPSIPSASHIRQGIIGASDVGFKELTRILKENRILSGQVEEIILGEVDIGGGMSMGNIPLTPQKMRFLGLIQNSEQKVVLQEQWDIYRITRNLRDWAMEITRNSVAIWIIVLLALYLIAGITLVIIT